MSRDAERAAHGYCGCELELPGGDRFACDLVNDHELARPWLRDVTEREHRARVTIVDARGYRLPIELRWSGTAYRPAGLLPHGVGL